jgi:hypothetical protein
MLLLRLFGLLLLLRLLLLRLLRLLLLWLLQQDWEKSHGIRSSFRLQNRFLSAVGLAAC